MIVLIGKGRRLTLRELQAIAFDDDCSVQWQSSSSSSNQVGTDNNTTTDDTAMTEGVNGGDNSSMIDLSILFDSAVSISEDPTRLTYGESLAILSILALIIAQGRVSVVVVPSSESPPQPNQQTSPDVNEYIANRLVQMIIQSKQQKQIIRLPSSESSLQSTLKILLTDTETVPVSSVIMIPLSTLERAVQLGSTGLQVIRSVDLAIAALPIAALSVDASGYASTLTDTAYTEVVFDVLRPHRSMVTSAATLRALLNDSRYTSSSTSTNSTEKPIYFSSLYDLPQYHGPALEDMKLSMKRLELELNGMAPNSDVILDQTVLQLVTTQTLHALNVLSTNSTKRIQMLVGTGDEEKVVSLAATGAITNLSNAVIYLESVLGREARLAINAIEKVDATRQKEAATTTSTAANNNRTNPSEMKTKEDEFQGMTEEQKMKIMKKRAEKEAKAAAKKQAKEVKGISLFGAGTPAVCQILISNSTNQSGQQQEQPILLTSTTITELVTLQEKLLSGGIQRKPKIPKGTRDYLPEQMMIRQKAFDIIRRVFQSHGAVEIDTPVFELKDTLTGKYGEDSKLIYDLADQGGELLALRYDLTVPFARFLSLNSVGNIKRFHIGKVYRRDQPALKRGRYREFYQCDFDIAGSYSRMVPDSECICVACDILHNLPIGDFGIKLNHRRLLDAILDICGVPADKFRTICSAVDKLDKEPWAVVKKEMVDEKGLPEEVANKIGEFVLNKGAPFELYKELMDTKKFGNHVGALEAMEDLRILFDYLAAFNKLQYISFDLSLARGLDYYTGVIYEAVCMNGNTQVGSIGGGGRYDQLVSMFQEAGKQTPCVGVSVGIERVFTLMEERMKVEQGGSIKQPNVSVLVAAAAAAAGVDPDGKLMMIEKMRITRILWDGHISAEFSQQTNPKLKKEIVNALERNIPFMVIIGENELQNQSVIVKDLKASQEETVRIVDLVAVLRQKGVVLVGCEFANEIMK